MRKTLTVKRVARPREPREKKPVLELSSKERHISRRWDEESIRKALQVLVEGNTKPLKNADDDVPEYVLTDAINELLEARAVLEEWRAFIQQQLAKVTRR